MEAYDWTVNQLTRKEHYASEKHKREIALHCREELDLAQAFCTQEQGTALRIYSS